jgi:hypothetical protein
MGYYFRHIVTLDSLIPFQEYELNLMCDDGAVIYINGEEVLRVNMPAGEIGYDTPAITYVGGTDESTYYIYHPENVRLNQGDNIIAVEVHQSGGTSSDISFDMDLSGKSTVMGEKVQYTGSPLNLTPGQGMDIKVVFEDLTSLPGLKINEFMASNQNAVVDEFGESADWIEIYNPGQDEVNIGGYYLTDDLNEPFKWQIPEGYATSTTIAAGGFIILYADEDTLQGPLHLGFRLDAAGEEIGLSTILNDVFCWIDTVSYNQQEINISCGRYPDGSPAWHLMTSYSPDAGNIVTSVQIPVNKPFTVDAYPNPAEDILFLDISGLPSGSASRIDLRLYDVTGRVILSEEMVAVGSAAEGAIDLSGIPAGIYILKVTDGTHGQSVRLLRK